MLLMFFSIKKLMNHPYKLKVTIR